MRTHSNATPLKFQQIAAARNWLLSAGVCEPRVPTDPLNRYVPREVARTVLYRAVAGAVETFLAIACERDRVVPRFVEREFRAYLE